MKIVKGRIERRMVRPDDSPLIGKLKDVFATHQANLGGPILVELEALCKMPIPQYTEKRVDVSIAVDMVTMAYSGQYDVAYLLSADGDFVPAVQAVRQLGKKVFAASPAFGYELGRVVDNFIPQRRDWFLGLFV